MKTTRPIGHQTKRRWPTRPKRPSMEFKRYVRSQRRKRAFDIAYRRERLHLRISTLPRMYALQNLLIDNASLVV